MDIELNKVTLIAPAKIAGKREKIGATLHVSDSIKLQLQQSGAIAAEGEFNDLGVADQPLALSEDFIAEAVETRAEEIAKERLAEVVEVAVTALQDERDVALERANTLQSNLEELGEVLSTAEDQAEQQANRIADLEAQLIEAAKEDTPPENEGDKPSNKKAEDKTGKKTAANS